VNTSRLGVVIPDLVDTLRPLGNVNTSGLGVVIPIRSFRSGKQRLAAVLDDTERTRLSRALADTAIQAADGFPILVVSQDNSVAEWADAHGITTVVDPQLDLNDAAELGRQQFVEAGATAVAVMHSDLPMPAAIHSVVDDTALLHGLIAPDRHGEGTNLLIVPTSLPFTFMFGPGSATHHRRQFEEVGTPVTILNNHGYDLDLDTPDDLLELERRDPSWRSTHAISEHYRSAR
jgi:2-phospho-L-lactate guanylyltransferase